MTPRSSVESPKEEGQHRRVSHPSVYAPHFLLPSVMLGMARPVNPPASGRASPLHTFLSAEHTLKHQEPTRLRGIAATPPSSAGRAAAGSGRLRRELLLSRRSSQVCVQGFRKPPQNPKGCSPQQSGGAGLSTLVPAPPLQARRKLRRGEESSALIAGIVLGSTGVASALATLPRGTRTPRATSAVATKAQRGADSATRRMRLSSIPRDHHLRHERRRNDLRLQPCGHGRSAR